MEGGVDKDLYNPSESSKMQQQHHLVQLSKSTAQGKEERKAVKSSYSALNDFFCEPALPEEIRCKPGRY